MSSSITQCPGCYTQFKVTTEQLIAHNGIVRCGLCSAIFNATEHLQDDEPSPQLKLPIAQPEHEASHSENIVTVTHAEEHTPLPAVTRVGRVRGLCSSRSSRLMNPLQLKVLHRQPINADGCGSSVHSY